MHSLKLVAFARGNELADGLLNGAEGCLLHLRAICMVVGRSIRVWDSGGEILGVFGLKSRGRKKRREIGDDVDKHLVESSICGDQVKSFVLKKNLCQELIELQYLDSSDGRIGHWQAANDGGDHPSTDNNCLFDAVCHQCRDFKPTKLRELTAGVLRRWDLVAEEVFPQFAGVGLLLVGGAKYDWRDHVDAGNVLDASQGTVGYRHNAKAHPRGHASHPRATGMLDSVENYSLNATRSFPKSAWMSRSEQDRDMHQLLLLPQVQRRMEDLNQRSETRVAVKVDVKELSIEILMGHWAEGVMFRGPVRADLVTIVLQHHRDKQDQPDADVQVFTCYPVEINTKKAEEPVPRSLLFRLIQSSDQNDNRGGNNHYLCLVQ